MPQHRSARKRQARRPDGGCAPPKAPWWILLVVAAVAFAVYAPTLGYQFVHDDDTQILKNPWIRDWQNLGTFFTTDVWRFRHPNQTSNYYRPIHMVLHMVGHSISGLEPWGYHLINVLLHTLCSVLVALIGHRLARSSLLGLASGLIFALHPVHAESVAWAAGVTDLACALFYFGGLYLYMLAGEGRRGRVIMGVSLLSFMLALLSKEMAFTLPAAAAFLDWCLVRRLRWQRCVALLAVFGGYSLLRIAALGRFHVPQSATVLDWGTTALSTAVLAGSYLAKLVVPHSIHAYHVFDPTTSPGSPEFLAAVGVVAAFGAAGWAARRDGAALFSIGFCLLALPPVLNISGIGENVMADRYLYIPSLGISLALPVLARHAAAKLPIAWRAAAAPAGWASLAVMLALYGWLLQGTVFMWRDAETLYRETLRRSPRAMVLANSLAAHYFYRGNHAGAKEWFDHALGIWGQPGVRGEHHLFDAYSGLGALALYSGDLDSSLEYFRDAERLMPEEVSVLQNLGVVYATMGDYATALEYYQRALRINPRSETTYGNLAAVYVKTGEFDKAIEHARKAIEIYPLFGDAYLSLSRAYAGKGLTEESRRAYEQAHRIDPTLR